VNAYFDTSALAKLLLGEPGSDEALACWRALGDGYATSIGYLELRSALDGARRGGRPVHIEPWMDEIIADALWEEITTVELDADVMAVSLRLLTTHGIRALDAIHLASALVVAGGEPLALVSFDRRLRNAARAEGLVVLPEAA
jgi:predicted nucleic acid-binding protein